MLRSRAQSSRLSWHGGKLRVDLRASKSGTGHMTKQDPLDPDSERLINELLTRIGIIMEDASVIALISDGTPKNLGKRIAALEHEAVAISALVRAAKTLKEA